MCEQLTIDVGEQKIDPQITYNVIRPRIDAILEKFNFSPSHIVATEITKGLSVRYNIKNSIFNAPKVDEHEFSSGSRVICRLTSNAKGTHIEIPSNRVNFYNSDFLPLMATKASTPTWRKIELTKDRLSSLSEAICKDIADFFLSYPSDFSCCSLYKECSNVGHCIQPNQDMAAGCYYKSNLMCGNIFYRENC